MESITILNILVGNIFSQSKYISLAHVPNKVFFSVHIQVSAFQKCRTKVLEGNFNYPGF